MKVLRIIVGIAIKYEGWQSRRLTAQMEKDLAGAEKTNIKAQLREDVNEARNLKMQAKERLQMAKGTGRGGQRIEQGKVAYRKTGDILKAIGRGYNGLRRFLGADRTQWGK